MQREVKVIGVIIRMSCQLVAANSCGGMKKSI